MRSGMARGVGRSAAPQEKRSSEPEPGSAARGHSRQPAVIRERDAPLQR